MLKKEIWLCMTLVFLIVFASCSSKEEEPLKIKTGIAARIRDTKITINEVEREYERLDGSMKEKFKGLKGKADLVDKMIEEQVVLNEALAIGLDEDPDVEAAIEQAKRAILLREYYAKKIMGKANVKEEEIEDFYEKHKEEFRTQSLVKAQHIMTSDSLKAVELKRMVDAGAKFRVVAKEHSEDRDTAVNGGDMGYFNPGGYIRSIGYSSRFSKAVERLEVGEISDVVAHERGYSIIRVNEKKPSKIRTLSETRQQIYNKLISDKSTEIFLAELDGLKAKYKTENYLREKLAESTRSPKELWEIAQIEDDPMERINYYLELVKQYPDHEYAPQALFMAGFVYAEEEKDFVEARRTFDRLIATYPGSEVVESAKWMIENLSKPHPKFESLESVKEQMSKEKNAEGGEKE